PIHFVVKKKNNTFSPFPLFQSQAVAAIAIFIGESTCIPSALISPMSSPFFFSSSNLHKINNLSHYTRSSQTPLPFSPSSSPHTITIFAAMIRSSHPHPPHSPLC
ncbi:hypothetical protein AABB24_013024, partial [Solanum stoloniferum]